VQRPAYSVLSKQKLRALGLSMPSWDDGLSRYLSARRQTPLGVSTTNMRTLA
jgi:dTDP-4-dehydrorhamnose reductase